MPCKYLVQTLVAEHAATEPIALYGPFAVSIISSAFHGIASVQKSLDEGATWVPVLDFPMKHIKGESLDHEEHLDEQEPPRLADAFGPASPPATAVFADCRTNAAPRRVRQPLMGLVLRSVRRGIERARNNTGHRAQFSDRVVSWF